MNCNQEGHWARNGKELAANAVNKTIKILMKLFEIKIVANNLLGWVSNLLSRLKVAGRLLCMSSKVLGESPKNATSDAEISPEIISNGTISRPISGEIDG